MKCECGQPPCKCTQDVRDYTCEHKLRGEYFEEERELGTFKGYRMYPCGKQGMLRDDCNTFWESRKVLCDAHYEENHMRAERPCGICGRKMRECVC